MWMGANLQYKGILEVMDTLSCKQRGVEPTAKEINKDWKRLASFMTGVK